MDPSRDNVGPAVHELANQVLVGEDGKGLLEGLEVIGGDQHRRWSAVAGHHDPLMGGDEPVHHLGQAVLHIGQRQSRHSQNRRPLSAFRNSTVAGRVVDLRRPHAEARGLVVRREVGIGRHDDHRIPDVVVARTVDLDEQEHYLLTADIVVEVLPPRERVDKLPFYRSCGVAEVVLVDPLSGTVKWLATPGPTGPTGYEPVSARAVVPVGPDALATLPA